jgi:hypothetical protein
MIQGKYISVDQWRTSGIHAHSTHGVVRNVAPAISPPSSHSVHRTTTRWRPHAVSAMQRRKARLAAKVGFPVTRKVGPKYGTRPSPCGP